MGEPGTLFTYLDPELASEGPPPRDILASMPTDDDIDLRNRTDSVAPKREDGAWSGAIGSCGRSSATKTRIPSGWTRTGVPLRHAICPIALKINHQTGMCLRWAKESHLALARAFNELLECERVKAEEMGSIDDVRSERAGCDSRTHGCAGGTGRDR